MYLSPKVIVIPAIRLGSSSVGTLTLPVPPVILVRAAITSSNCAFSSGSALVITAVSAPLAADRSWLYMSITLYTSFMRPPSASADRALFVLSHAPDSAHRLTTPATFFAARDRGVDHKVAKRRAGLRRLLEELQVCLHQQELRLFRRCSVESVGIPPRDAVHLDRRLHRQSGGAQPPERAPHRASRLSEPQHRHKAQVPAGIPP